MHIAHTKKRYQFFHDESNNVRTLLIDGDQYNIDADENQDSSSTFVLGGVAYAPQNDAVDFSTLLSGLRLQKSAKELKFNQMVVLCARHSPKEAFLLTLGSPKFQYLFKWMLEKNVFLHYSSKNMVYWAFLDIIEDLVLCAGDFPERESEFEYKDSLYRLIKSDKAKFLSLMSTFDYPAITKEKSLPFAKALHELITEGMARAFMKDREAGDAGRFLRLGFLVYRCLMLHESELNFALVYEGHKNVLIEDFCHLYGYRLKSFPCSKHILDMECNIETKLAEQQQVDSALANIDYTFVNSNMHANLGVQVADVIAGFVRIFLHFIEGSTDEDISGFLSYANPRQLETLALYKKLVERSANEYHLLLHRIIVPSDEVKASNLMALIGDI